MTNLNGSPAIWALRLLLAALLLLGSEIILWLRLPDYDAVDWIVRIVGYPLLATLILDVVQRYRARDVYDAMIVFAGYALLHSLVIDPVAGWSDFPAGLLTRILGAQALTNLIMWGVLLALLRGDIMRYRLILLAGIAWLALYFGIWMRWVPDLRGTFAAIPLPTILLIVAVVYAGIVLQYGVVRRFARGLSPARFMLSPLEWALAAVLLILLLMWQTVRGDVDMAVLGLASFVLTICWGILWFRREPNERTLLEQHLPLQPLGILWLLLAALVFGIVTVIGYYLPLADAGFVNQLWLMEIGFFAVGTLWLPLVAAVIATGGTDQMLRTGMDI